ncbi:hypothetical protein NUF47_003398 [Yersinia enterocolitica]|uniref:hypothetical protein n=1 Tax=Yersinia intermedia TaxID=631 RepID=UPI0005ABE24B|nr:hypothetical protein [Yersinia intermedia]AJJ18264.1 hypothetical protein CH53_1839 [Yersinia intermedia]EKN4195708.1 hypothetical protein [Yersinia enterocolitica]EKN6131566.1 hypothetical protein [Yersinia enterocolitica]
MSLDEKITKILEDKKASYISSFRFNEISGSILLEIPLDTVRDTATGGFTSKRQINNLVKLLENELDKSIIVSFRQSKTWNDLEAGLRALLIKLYQDKINDLVISSTNQTSSIVWVFINIAIDDETKKDIENFISNYLSNALIILDAINFIFPKKQEPSSLAILRTIKIESPVLIEKLFNYLVYRDFYIPSEKWLSARLDVLRKKGFIIRNIDGSYALSGLGLSVVPSTTSKSSSDIERILSLAKRRIW